jgi:hypothetical protein
MNTMRRIAAFGGTALLVLALCGAFVLPAVADGQNGTTLSATVDVTPHWTITYGWTIDKSVTPNTWNLFRGDSGTSQYTITVTKGGGTEEAWVDGQVCVTNGGAVDTVNLAIEAVLQDGYGSPNDFLTSAPVDVSGYPIIPAGGSHCYNYHVNIPITGGAYPQPHAGGTYKVTANVTITNHSGHLDVPFGPSPSATTEFPASQTLINNTINVDDTNGGSWPFSASGSVTYNKTFTCDGDAGTHNNTATIRETGQSDSASVTVNCYALQVTKDAATSFTRTYQWGIDKSADWSSLTLALNQSYVVNYSVVVGLDTVKYPPNGYVDSDWAVNGTITVKNPAPIDATINSVTDVLPGATVNCGVGVTFPYDLPAGGTLTCSYSADLPDASSGTNTATATLQNYNYDYQMNATVDGTTDFSGSKNFDFSSATMTEKDKCIDVSDTYAGSLGPVCVGDAPKTFTYSRTIGPYSTSGDYTVVNTASFVTKDTGATGNDSWTVNVHVPGGGCSLTIGYWKNHAGFEPQADMVTPLLPQLLGTSGGAKTQNVTTAALAVQFLSFNGSNGVFDASNGINKLYAQLLGAKLDIANGADGSAVASTISAADAFLATHDSTAWSGLSKADKNKVLGWMTTLDNYNNGLIGPGHCSQ